MNCLRLPGIYILALFALTLNGCKKDVANGNAGIEYNLQTTNRSSIVQRTNAGNIQWTSGHGSVTEIKFEAKSNNIKTEFRSDIPYHIDLFSGITSIGNISLPAGTYDEVAFKVELDTHGSYAAFELNGKFTSGTTTIPVVFKVNTDFEIETETKSIIVTSNKNYLATTSLNLAPITNGVTESMLSSAARSNGSIVISSTSNANIYHIILGNLSDSDGVEFKDK